MINRRRRAGHYECLSSPVKYVEKEIKMQGHREWLSNPVITINAPLILNMRDSIFLCGQTT